MNARYRLIIFFCIILALCEIAIASDQNESQISQSGSGNLTEILFVPDVQTILESPEQYFGKKISLQAVVSKTYSQKHQFAVADRVGCSLCTTKNAKNSIKIWYAGEIPKYREIVQITGEVIPDTNKGYHLNATSVKN